MDNIGKVGQSSFFGKIGHHHALYMVTFAQLMNSNPLGVKNTTIFAIQAVVSEIQLSLTSNGKLALIGQSLGRNYLAEYPVGLKLCKMNPGEPNLINMLLFSTDIEICEEISVLPNSHDNTCLN